MSKVNAEKYSLDTLLQHFVLDPESPSGLNWKCDSKRRQYKKAGARSGALERMTRYWKVKLNGSELYVHRVICLLLYGSMEEGHVIDHIDGDGLNNKIENLRVVPPTINNRNRQRQINSSKDSQLMGVTKNFQPTKHSGGILSYKAIHYDIDGTVYRKYFNIAKYGEDLALLLALCWKFHWLENDKTYTEGHGNDRKKRS